MGQIPHRTCEVLPKMRPSTTLATWGIKEGSYEYQDKGQDMDGPAYHVARAKAFPRSPPQDFGARRAADKGTNGQAKADDFRNRSGP